MAMKDDGVSELEDTELYSSLGTASHLDAYSAAKDNVFSLIPKYYKISGNVTEAQYGGHAEYPDGFYKGGYGFYLADGTHILLSNQESNSSGLHIGFFLQ